MIVNISGNVKNGLINFPSSTGGLRDKFAVGGNRINRHGRTWEYDEKIGAYVPITNRTISRTSAYPINKSARGETIVGSDYIFRMVDGLKIILQILILISLILIMEIVVLNIMQNVDFLYLKMVLVLLVV